MIIRSRLKINISYKMVQIIITKILLINKILSKINKRLAMKINFFNITKVQLKRIIL